MIHVMLDGRLGNMLFQYAVGRALSIKHRSNVCLYAYRLPQRDGSFAKDGTISEVVNDLAYFHIEAEITYRKPAMAYPIIARAYQIFSNKVHYYREEQSGFNPDVLELPDESYLNGYFQSEKYFKESEDIIRKELRFKKEPRDAESIWLEQKIKRTNAISVHIRRSDYVNHPLLPVCDIAYYHKAMAYMRERLQTPHFFIFSDDMDWCRQHFRMPHCDLVASPLAQTQPVVDFQLMSMCRHHIIANSTFSWWAAWLNPIPEKIVVTPHNWFNDASMNDRAMRDLIPEEWICICE